MGYARIPERVIVYAFSRLDKCAAGSRLLEATVLPRRSCRHPPDAQPPIAQTGRQARDWRRRGPAQPAIWLSVNRRRGQCCLSARTTLGEPSAATVILIRLAPSSEQVAGESACSAVVIE